MMGTDFKKVLEPELFGTFLGRLGIIVSNPNTERHIFTL